MARPIVIDADPSPDDAVAFLVALGSPEALEVLAITTVGGNAPLPATTKNALKALELTGRGEIPVYAGAGAPLSRKLATAEHVHGADGFAGYDLPEPKLKPAEGFAPDAIVEIVMSRPERTVTMCCLAPLTNLALALAKEPRLASRLGGIVLMGGAHGEGGNVTPCAEYNVWVDPEAARAVFACAAPIVMIPLDCTHQALTTRARMDALRAAGAPHMEVLYHLLTANKRFDERKYGTDGGPLHDPTVIAYLLRPELFAGREVNVEISCDALTRGMTIVDWWGVTGKPATALVLREIDADGYFELVIERLARAGGVRGATENGDGPTASRRGHAQAVGRDTCVAANHRPVSSALISAARTTAANGAEFPSEKHLLAFSECLSPPRKRGSRLVPRLRRGPGFPLSRE